MRKESEVACSGSAGTCAVVVVSEGERVSRPGGKGQGRDGGKRYSSVPARLPLESKSMEWRNRIVR